MMSLEMALIESASHFGVFAFDEYYRYKLMRGSLHRTAGFTPDVSEGKNLYQLLPKSEWLVLESYYSRALDGERFAVQYSSPIDGNTYHVDFFPIDFHGERYGGGVVRDITSVLDAERLLNTKENKEDLSALVGKYYTDVAELLITLADDPAICNEVKSKAQKVFSKTIGLQKFAGNVLYDFTQFKLDDLILLAHRKTDTLINLNLNGGVIKADKNAFVSALADILANIKTEGVFKSNGLEFEILFSPPDHIDDFEFDVAIAVFEAHGYTFKKEALKGFITYKFERK